MFVIDYIISIIGRFIMYLKNTVLKISNETHYPSANTSTKLRPELTFPKNIATQGVP